ncbi:MAG TPA: acyl-ACP--UDP-N-acetylglucosamine O-acyltransferase [Gallionellaceae bacterium]|nr:acyl-ACP--UDP-N-acetylglucosamine O-acyltransferase [Gallionellaceae bacterium]
MALIHPTAIIEPGARLADDVKVGAYSVIGPNVEIGEGTEIGPHVVIEGHTRIGRKNRIFQFSSLGGIPQDKKYAGEATRLEIGDNNLIRECCTFNIGTVQDGGVTRIGSNNWIMAYVHLAHDCQVGNGIVLANSVQLAGHVEVDDYAILGAYVGAHQFCKVGAHVMVGAGSLLFQDLPPYVMVGGNPATPHGINSEGLKRRGFSSPTIMAIKRAYKTLYRSGLSLEQAVAEITAQSAEYPELKLFTDFIARSTRGLIR